MKVMHSNLQLLPHLSTHAEQSAIHAGQPRQLPVYRSEQKVGGWESPELLIEMSLLATLQLKVSFWQAQNFELKRFEG